MEISQLTPAQQEIVELVNQGVTDPNDIAKKLGKSLGIVKAQITRIKTAGGGHLVESVEGMKTDEGKTSQSRPRSTGESSNQQVLEEAQKAGQAQYEIPEELVDAANIPERDIHPMVLLGTTIQFMKLVGGRLAAHQLIESVYEAFRAMAGEGTPKVGEENWSAPWPLNQTEMELDRVKRENKELREALEKANQ